MRVEPGSPYNQVGVFSTNLAFFLYATTAIILITVSIFSCQFLHNRRHHRARERCSNVVNSVLFASRFTVANSAFRHGRPADA
jgi:hypothetical protein